VREIAVAASATSAEVAHRCAIECGADFAPSVAGTGQQATCWMRDSFIGLVDCLAQLTDAVQPDEDAGVAPESCASACFEGWR
jgi:hypothetical protein